MGRITRIGIDTIRRSPSLFFFEETPAGGGDRKDVILNEVKDLSFQSLDSSKDLSFQSLDSSSLRSSE